VYACNFLVLDLFIVFNQITNLHNPLSRIINNIHEKHPIHSSNYHNILSVLLYTVSKAVGINWTKSTVDKDFDTTKIFNKETGLKISKKEFEALVHQNQIYF
jgi:hypothetical protein